MPRISTQTLQKRYGGKWVALSPGEGKVYAAHRRFDGLLLLLRKKGINTKRVVFSKIAKFKSLSVY